MLSNVLTREMWAESFNNLWKFNTLTITIPSASRVTATTSLSRIQGEGAAKASIVYYWVAIEPRSGEQIFVDATRIYEPAPDIYGNLVVREWWIAEGKSRIAAKNVVSVTFRIGAGPNTFAHAVCSVFVHDSPKPKPPFSLVDAMKAIPRWVLGKNKLEKAKADRADETTRTLVVFDRTTGDIVHVHHLMIAPGVRAPEEAQVAAEALRMAEQVGERAQAELDTISVNDSDLAPRKRLKVDVTSRRLVAIDEPSSSSTS